MQAGRIDLLVNNAGYAQAGAIEETSLSEVQAQFDTNVFGVLRVINVALPIMRRQHSAHIINVSSLLGHIALSYLGVYASSKFALEGLSEALRSELRPFNIDVSLVEPAFVKTNFAGQRPAHPLADYEARRQMVLHIATLARPRLRYPIGRESNLLITLKRRRFIHTSTELQRSEIRRAVSPRPGCHV